MDKPTVYEMVGGCIPEPARGIMRDYFERASSFMINIETPQDEL